MQKYGCAFTAMAYYRERYMGKPWALDELAMAWNTAVALGVVSGDLNGDGDYDDPGEATIQDWQRLSHHLGLPLKFLGKYPLGHQVTAWADTFVLTAWTNPKNGFVHWVVGDKRPVEFDPIFPASITVRDGQLFQINDKGHGGHRVFQRV